MSLVQEILTPEYLTILAKADRQWLDLRQGNISPPETVTKSETNLGPLDWDIVVAGGTLGILIAPALQRLGWRVVVIERGILRGREQEWNISRSELEVLLELELLSTEELEQAIATEFNPVRISFSKDYELWVKDVLNVGVNPRILLETLKQKFLTLGGTLLENTPYENAIAHSDGILVKAGNHTLKTRLLIDAMGHFSPLTQQARKAELPQGVCLVVGSCAQGYPQNQTGDLIASFTPIQNNCQYFWEAFPARDGRTTYLFTYLDANPERFSLEFLLEEYLRLLPEYQQIELSELEFKRFLFGFFPAYQNSPLQSPWSRILFVGDSSGAQSPVSFGGFGAMLRHLKRLTLGIDEALKIDALTQQDLAALQPYQPNLSVTWLFQKAMSIRGESKIDPSQINDLMSGVFQAMDKLGDDVVKPFLQDVVQFGGLAKTLPLVNPKLVLPIIPQVGILSLMDWTRHYLNLALYTGLYPLGRGVSPLVKYLNPHQQYLYHRQLDAWQYGAGKDIH
jgi:lycopene cyclase CruP